MSDAKRQDIQDRIAVGEARNSTRNSTETQVQVPREYEDFEDESDVVVFIKEHPFVTLAGALAVGVLVAGMFPSTRRAARRGGDKASAWSAAGTSAVVAAFQSLQDVIADAGRASGETLEDWSDSVADQTRKARREASYLAERSRDEVGAAARDTGESISRSFRRLWR